MDEYVLITGASSGIGRALADEFALHGNNLLLVARRLDRLENAALEITKKNPVKVLYKQADLTDENAIETLYDFCREQNISIKILINNAGIGTQGLFTDIPSAAMQNIIDINISAPMKMCSVFLPDMKRQGYGTVANIASTTAFMPLANEAVYAASKAFVLSFSQALYEEMKPFGVSVCTVCPGVTDTEFFQTADFSLDHFKGASPSDFAAFAYKNIIGKTPLCVHRFSNKAISVWARLFPRGIVRSVSAKFG